MADRSPSPEVRRPRGRPKGTGIDDRDSLARIAELMRSDASLRATTAIRKAGVSDPSVIRRLRDKLKAGVGGSEQPSARLSPDHADPIPRVAPAQTLLPTVPAASHPSPAGERLGDMPKVAEQVTVPPTAQDTPRQAQERALLAAYLEAMSAPRATEVRPSDDPPLPPPAAARNERPSQTSPASGSTNAPQAERRQEAQPAGEAHRPAAAATPPFGFWPFAPAQSPGPASNPFLPWLSMFPGAGAMPGFPPMPPMPSAPPAGMSMPWLPPFLQPFQQRGGASQPTPDAARQMEGMRLAVEAMTAMARLQLHLTENAMAYSPMALMLQGQAFVGQMLLAAFSGQASAMTRPGSGGPPR